jgi:hypothetical protein
MRQLALGALLVLGTTACSEGMVTHADPPCAFDETGCVPAELTLALTASDGGPSAVLRATSPLAGNSWVQEGIRGNVDWLLPGGNRLQEEKTLGTVVLQGTRGPVAPRVELSVESDADRVSVEIAPAGESAREHGFKPIRIRPSPSVVPLEHGIYVLRVQASWPQGEAVFFFTLDRV